MTPIPIEPEVQSPPVAFVRARARPVPEVPRVHLSHQGDYRFVVSFGAEEVPDLMTDEPSPLGTGAGPTPVLLLAAAVGNCLASSLKFCMSRARLELLDLSAEVATKLIRDEHGRLRVERMDVRMVPTVTPAVQQQMGRCLETFESYCIVAETVRKAIPVCVDITPRIAAGGPLA
jgi:uncharacterized OsmC-like protein